MSWEIRIADEAGKEYRKLEGSARRQVLAGILKPAPVSGWIRETSGE